MKIPINDLLHDDDDPRSPFVPQPGELSSAEELDRSDPELRALLDDVLHPEAPPVGLERRVLAATSDQLPSGVQDCRRGDSVDRAGSDVPLAVVGRIGWRRVLRYAVAAVLMIGWTGIWAIGGGIVRDARHIVIIEQGFGELAAYESADLPIDAQIQTVADDLGDLQMTAWDAAYPALQADLDTFESWNDATPQQAM